MYLSSSSSLNFSLNSNTCDCPHRRSHWNQGFKKQTNDIFFDLTSGSLLNSTTTSEHGRQIQAIIADEIDRDGTSSQPAALLQHETGRQQVDFWQCVFHLGQCRLPSCFPGPEEPTDEPIAVSVGPHSPRTTNQLGRLYAQAGRLYQLPGLRSVASTTRIEEDMSAVRSTSSPYLETASQLRMRYSSSNTIASSITITTYTLGRRVVYLVDQTSTTYNLYRLESIPKNKRSADRLPCVSGQATFCHVSQSADDRSLIQA